MAADAKGSWIPFLQQVKARPVPFYQKCSKRLLEEDLYEPSDLELLDVEVFARKLQDAGATTGEIAFLREAVMLAKDPRVAAAPAAAPAAGYPTAGYPTAGSQSIPVVAAVSAAPVNVPSGKVAQARPLDEDEPDVIDRARPTALTLVLPGNEDPRALMLRGGMEVEWNSKGRRVIRKFREKPRPRIRDRSLTLPPLFLHFLDKQFLPMTNPVNSKFSTQLRCGNDNEEILIVLPEKYIARKFGIDGELGQSLERVLSFLKQQADAEVSSASIIGLAGNFHLSATPHNLYFGLKAARPKAKISLDKPAFGIPEEAQMYLFAQNHLSVSYMSAEDRAAFQLCIKDLGNLTKDKDLQLLSVFLKIFYEGGFAYNACDPLGPGGYLPRNVGLAALGLEKSFDGQQGISTGYPYLLESQFLRFSDTVEVTIGPIRDMSERHGRYGLCFTRCVYIWEDEALEREDTLCFCSIAPHGGFYYVPSSLEQYNLSGGFVYAFGEEPES